MATPDLTPLYQSFRETLIALRNKQGVTQVELARRLGRPQQFVSRIEQGIRRLDVVEFYLVMKALDIDPISGLGTAIERFPFND